MLHIYHTLQFKKGLSPIETILLEVYLFNNTGRRCIPYRRWARILGMKYWHLYYECQRLGERLRRFLLRSQETICELDVSDAPDFRALSQMSEEDLYQQIYGFTASFIP